MSNKEIIDITPEFAAFYPKWKYDHERAKLQNECRRIIMALCIPREAVWPLNRLADGIDRPDGKVAYGILETMYNENKFDLTTWDRIRKAITYFHPAGIKRQRLEECTEVSVEAKDDNNNNNELHEEAKPRQESVTASLVTDVNEYKDKIDDASEEDKRLAYEVFRRYNCCNPTEASLLSIEARQGFRKGDRVKRNGKFGILLEPIQEDTGFRKADQAVALVVKYDKTKRKPLWDKYTGQKMVGGYHEFTRL